MSFRFGQNEQKVSPFMTKQHQHNGLKSTKVSPYPLASLENIEKDKWSSHRQQKTTPNYNMKSGVYGAGHEMQTEYLENIPISSQHVNSKQQSNFMHKENNMKHSSKSVCYKSDPIMLNHQRKTTPKPMKSSFKLEENQLSSRGQLKADNGNIKSQLYRNQEMETVQEHKVGSALAETGDISQMLSQIDMSQIEWLQEFLAAQGENAQTELPPDIDPKVLELIQMLAAQGEGNSLFPTQELETKEETQLKKVETKKKVEQLNLGQIEENNALFNLGPGFYVDPEVLQGLDLSALSNLANAGDASAVMNSLSNIFGGAENNSFLENENQFQIENLEAVAAEEPEVVFQEENQSQALLESLCQNLDLSNPGMMENLQTIVSALTSQNASNNMGHNSNQFNSTNHSNNNNRNGQSGRPFFHNSGNNGGMRRENSFNRSNSNRWNERSSNNNNSFHNNNNQHRNNRNYIQNQEDTINFENNPLGQKNWNRNNGQLERRPFETNKFTYRKKRPLDQHLHTMTDSQYKSSQENEKLLGVPLNEMAYNSNSVGVGSNSFLQRGENKTKETQEGAEKAVPPMSYYSDKLDLAEKYNNDNETPITKTLRKTLMMAEQQKNIIESSIQDFESNLHNAKYSFFALQPGFDLGNIDSHIDDLLAMNNKSCSSGNSTLKKSIQKLSRKDSGSSSKRKKEKLKKGNNAFGGLTNSQRQRLYGGGISDVDSESAIAQITQTVKNEFDVDPDHYQLSCIQKILKQESSIYRATSILSKSLVYQTAAMISSGIVVYVHPSVFYLVSLEQSLCQSLSGTSLVSKEKVTQSVELAREGKFKVLFTTPEKFISEKLANVLDISFICLDEAHYAPGSSVNFRPQYNKFVSELNKSFNTIPVLAFIPPVSIGVCEEFSGIMNIPKSNVFPLEYFNTGIYDVNITRDKEKFPALLNLLKSRRFKDICQSMIIYTESKKSADDLAKLMGDNGYKASVLHNLKSEAAHQKPEMLPKLIKSNQGIMICVSNNDLAIDRGFANCVIHYSMPKNLEFYIQEITGLKDQTVSHLFLNKNDYFDLRLSIRDEMVDRDQLQAVIGKIFEANQNKKKGKLNMEIEGREEERELLIVKVSEFCKAVDLKRELIGQIFELLQESSDWLEYHRVVSANCSLKIMPGKEEQAMQHPLIQLITEDGKKESGIYEFVILDKAVDLKCSVTEVTKALKNLMNDHIIHYDMEEAFSFRIIMDPNPALIDQTLEEIEKKIHNKVLASLQKLDVMFAISKLNSVKTHRHLQIKADKIPRSPNSFIENNKRMERSPITPRDKETTTNFIEFFERYLNYKGDVNSGYGPIWDHTSSIRDVLPLIKIQTQREKSNLLADITPVVQNICDEIMTINPGENVENIKPQIMRSVLKIMQGLEVFSLNTDWKSNTSYGKYKNYDYDELQEMIFELVNNVLIEKMK